MQPHVERLRADIMFPRLGEAHLERAVAAQDAERAQEQEWIEEEERAEKQRAEQKAAEDTMPAAVGWARATAEAQEAERARWAGWAKGAMTLPAAAWAKATTAADRVADAVWPKATATINANSLGENFINDISDPITYEIMKVPVVAWDGNSYEFSTIDEWFKKRREQRLPPTSPSTGAILPNTILIPNFALKKIISDYNQKNPITFEIMEDPVITWTGNSYSRFQTRGWCNPRETSNILIIPNLALKRIISDYKQKNPVGGRKRKTKKYKRKNYRKKSKKRINKKIKSKKRVRKTRKH